MWSEKVSLVRDMKDLKMVSQEWMYKNIMNMSDDEWKLEQAKVINDLKLGFRHEQIENEGNDPVKTGQSFGTAHDIALNCLAITSPSQLTATKANTFETLQRA